MWWDYGLPTSLVADHAVVALQSHMNIGRLHNRSFSSPDQGAVLTHRYDIQRTLLLFGGGR